MPARDLAMRDTRTAAAARNSIKPNVRHCSFEYLNARRMRIAVVARPNAKTASPQSSAYGFVARPRLTPKTCRPAIAEPRMPVGGGQGGILGGSLTGKYGV